MWREEDEENFYATLSDDFSTFSCKSADDSALSEDLRLSEELYGGSFTTVANDDFEFHDTRPCGGEVRMKPCLVSPATPPASRKTSFRDQIRLKVNLPTSPPTQSVPAIPKEEDEFNKDPDLFILPPAEWKNDDEDECSTPPSDLPTPPERTTSMSRQPKSTTSFSMNDLDLIHKGPPAPGLPVKSESTMSLYRLNVDQDVVLTAMTPSRSENNVNNNNNGDSGFGSGAQSTNPVWSGFLCRKPSDPFWNMRKPNASSSSSSSTPTKNYPGILMHPRMRKIPWITAWKKLDEHSIHNERNQLQQSPPGWKDNLVYESSNVEDTPQRVGTIDEELSSDLGSPVCNIQTTGDYNLNIFAKESGVLIENAYGKLVRDDCGVQVNFYKKNVPCEGDGGRGDLSNLFERSVERPACLPIREQVCYLRQEDKIENRYPFQQGEGDVCEKRSSGGQLYENLFSPPKENIFADIYVDRSSFLVGNENVYGRLNKAAAPRPKLTRRESDNRGVRARNHRRENRTRSDTRDMFPPPAPFELQKKNVPVEIEMKSVVSCDGLARSGSQKAKQQPDQPLRKAPERKTSGGRIPVHVKSPPKPLDVSFRCGQPLRKSAERRAIPRPVERKNSKTTTTPKNEGLWANAIPFSPAEENGNSPGRPPFKRPSPRKSQLPRRESNNKNPVKRKANHCPPEPADDFLKCREKCEDNFSHIQNLNQGMKLNGNEYQHGYPRPPPLDENDNRNLTIADFL